MYEDRFKMSPLEKEDTKRILANIEQYGKLYRLNRATGQPQVDGGGTPIETQFERVAGSPTLRARFIVDQHGAVWTFMARGASKCPHLADGGGSPARSDYVEMWTGGWRKIEHPRGSGEWTYAKNTIWVNMDGHVQGHPYAAKIDWMKQTKGWKHPYDEPQSPTNAQLASLESKLRAQAPVILAQQRTELANSGLEKADEYIQAAEANAVEKTTPIAGMPVPDHSKRPEPIPMKTPAPEPTPEPAVSTVPDAAQKISAHPKAIELAAANGIDLASVKGTGKNGRILVGDVRPLVPAPAVDPIQVAPPAAEPETPTNDAVQVGRSNKQ